jgi:virulence-associated protein VagC
MVNLKYLLYILFFYFIFSGQTTYKSNANFYKTQPSTEGQLIFEEMGCVMCHGHQGMGDGFLAEGLNPQPRDFTSYNEMKLVPYQSMYSAIKNGIPYTSMPSFQLSDKQIDDVISYVRSFLTENHITITTCANNSKVVSLENIDIEKPFEVEVDKKDYVEVLISGDKLIITPKLISLLKVYKKDRKSMLRVHINLIRKEEKNNNYLAIIALRLGNCLK